MPDDAALAHFPRPVNNRSLILKIDEEDHDFFEEVCSVSHKILLSKLVFSLVSDLQEENEQIIENLTNIALNHDRLSDIEDAIKYADLYTRKLRKKMGFDYKNETLGFNKTV